MDHSREIRQLWFVAKSYFEEAEKLKIKRPEHLDIGLSNIMDFYEDGIPTEDYQIKLTLLVAHLNSAAIRLCTINERFREDLGGEIIKDYETELLRKRRKLEDAGLWNCKYLAEELIRNKEEYLPEMLRDSVAHRERAKSRKKGDIWQARQAAIESLKVIEVFISIQSSIELFETNLRERKFIS
jgi:hypothetical protein